MNDDLQNRVDENKRRAAYGDNVVFVIFLLTEFVCGLLIGATVVAAFLQMR